MNIKDPIFQTYVITASLMCLKMMLQAWVTVYHMIKCNGGFLHPEDIKKTGFNPAPHPDQLKPNSHVERSRAMQPTNKRLIREPPEPYRTYGGTTRN